MAPKHVLLQEFDVLKIHVHDMMACPLTLANVMFLYQNLKILST